MLSRLILSLATALSLTGPAVAVAPGSLTLPKLDFDGAHNSLQWMPAPGVGVLETIASNASWYGPGFHGRLTASGEVFNQYSMTAAHKSLPFGTRVRVTNLYNGRSTVVRINDRGPFIGGRVVDLSMAAAERIGMISSGTAPVSIQVLR